MFGRHPNMAKISQPDFRTGDIVVLHPPPARRAGWPFPAWRSGNPRKCGEHSNRVWKRGPSNKFSRLQITIKLNRSDLAHRKFLVSARTAETNCCLSGGFRWAVDLPRCGRLKAPQRRAPFLLGASLARNRPKQWGRNGHPATCSGRPQSRC